VHGRTADQRTPTWRRVLRSAARVQIAVTLALVPAGIVLFNQLSLISPLANAVAIPVVSWIVTPVALVGSACAVLPGPSVWLAEGLLALAHDVFAVLAAGLESLSALPAAMRAVATPPWPAIALGVFGIGWGLAPPGCPSRRLGLALALPLFVWPAVRPTPGELWLTALDVGQGSAVLLETHDRAWLYDSGPRYSNDSDAGERIVLPYLRYRGIARLDGLIVSHLDADHAGGTAAILRGIDVARVVTSVRSDDPLFLGRAVDRCIDGMHWGDGALRFQVLHPTAADYERRRPTNAMSCVVLAAVDERRVLLAGDVSATDEAAVLARWPGLRAEWLAAPHHGSRSSSSAALLATLGARHAVAQAGYRNRYGHPDPTVVARYAQYGVDLARTDRAGALQWRFTADGGVARRAWRSERVRYWHDRAETAFARAEPGDEPFDIVPSEPFIAG
jgi:competence protein ComEC